MKVIDFTTAVTARQRAARFGIAKRAFKAMSKRWATRDQYR